jgi:hypothetical protein
MVTAKRPPLVTRGQKTAPRHRDIRKSEEELRVKLNVDWLDATFKPDMSPQKDWETNAIDEQFPQYIQEEWEMIERRTAALHDRRYQALLVNRERLLRGQIILAISLAMGVAPGDWIELPRGINGYGKALMGPNGARVDYEPLGQPARWDFHAMLPGKACMAIGHERMVKLLKYMCESAARFTRLDVAIDDYTKIITPLGVLHYLKVPRLDSEVVTHASKFTNVNSGELGSGNQTADTLYIGSPKSRNYLRIYDKDEESHGEIPAIRWELQCRAESAETLGPLLAGCDWRKVIPQRLVSFIDFRAKDKTDVEKRTRLAWFAMLVKDASRANMYSSKAFRTLEDAAEWVIKVVAPTLAAVFAGTAGDIGEIMDLIREGRKRWKPQQAEAVRAWQDAGNAPLQLVNRR